MKEEDTNTVELVFEACVRSIEVVCQDIVERASPVP